MTAFGRPPAVQDQRDRRSAGELRWPVPGELVRRDESERDESERGEEVHGPLQRQRC